MAMAFINDDNSYFDDQKLPIAKFYDSENAYKIHYKKPYIKNKDNIPIRFLKKQRKFLKGENWLEVGMGSVRLSFL